MGLQPADVLQPMERLWLAAFTAQISLSTQHESLLAAKLAALLFEIYFAGTVIAQFRAGTSIGQVFSDLPPSYTFFSGGIDL